MSGRLLEPVRVFAYRLLGIGRDDDRVARLDQQSNVPEGQFNRRGIAEPVSAFRRRLTEHARAREPRSFVDVGSPRHGE